MRPRLMEAELARHPCCVCCAQAPEPLYLLARFHITRCAHCGLVYVEPRLTDRGIFEIYRNDYDSDAGSTFVVLTRNQ